MSFNNKVVIVTGGASGIGLATVTSFCKKGAKVVIADLNEQGQAVSDDLNKQGFVTSYFQIDVRNEQENKALIQHTVDTFSGLDIVFANAGVAIDAPIDQLPLDRWQKTIDINFK